MGRMEEPWAGQELEDIVFDHSRAPNVDEKQKYLQLLAEGVGHYNASRLTGKTASAYRAARKRDLRFGALAAAAEKIAGEEGALEETIRGTMIEVALGHLLADDGEEHPKAFEALMKLAEMKLPELEYKRTRSVRHGQDGPFEILVGAKVTPEWLASLSDEQLAALEAAQAILEAGQQGLRAIEGGQS